MADQHETPHRDGGSFEQHRELHDAREQSVASRDILVALGRAGADRGEILDTVVEHAARLCGADVAQLYLRDGDHFRLSRVAGAIPETWRRYLVDHPVAMNHSSYEQDESFLVRTAYGSSRALLVQLRAITIRLESTLVGRTVLARRPREVPDLGQVELDPHLDAPREAERALQEGPVVG